MTHLRPSRILWIGAAAILVAVALVALVAVVRGQFSDTDGRIIGSLGSLLACGGTALAGATLAERGPARSVGWLVAATSAVAFALALVAIWSTAFDAQSETASKLGVSGLTITATGLLTTTALLLGGRTALLPLAAAAGVLSTAAGALLVIGTWAEPMGDALWKVFAVFAILAGLAYLLVPVLLRFTRAGVEPGAVRVLGTLDGVEVLATRSVDDAAVEIARPRPGERLVLRRTSS